MATIGPKDGGADRRDSVLRDQRAGAAAAQAIAVEASVQRRRFVRLAAGPDESSSAQEIVLQKDFLNVTTEPTSSVEVAFTRDSDAGMRAYIAGNSEQFSHQFWDCDGGAGDWLSTSSGAGATATVLPTDHIGGSLHVSGEWGLGTGTTSTGYGAFYRQPFAGFGDGTAYEFECRATNGALSTGAEEFQMTVGFADTFTTTGQPVDAACFIYRRDVDGDFWVAITRSNSTETKTVTAVAPGGYSAMTIFRVSVTADGTSAVFAINGTTVATHTTNIPTGASRLTGMGMKLEKVAGTTARYAYVDWFRLRKTRTAAR